MASRCLAVPATTMRDSCRFTPLHGVPIDDPRLAIGNDHQTEATTAHRRDRFAGRFRHFTIHIGLGHQSHPLKRVRPAQSTAWERINPERDRFHVKRMRVSKR